MHHRYFYSSSINLEIGRVSDGELGCLNNKNFLRMNPKTAVNTISKIRIFIQCSHKARIFMAKVTRRLEVEGLRDQTVMLPCGFTRESFAVTLRHLCNFVQNLVHISRLPRLDEILRYILVPLDEYIYYRVDPKILFIDKGIKSSLKQIKLVAGTCWSLHRKKNVVMDKITHAAVFAVQFHHNCIIMSAMASRITSLTIVYSTIYSGVDQRKHQSSVSLAFVRGIHRWLVNSPHKGPVTRKMLPFDDVIM